MNSCLSLFVMVVLTNATDWVTNERGKFGSHQSESQAAQD